MKKYEPTPAVQSRLEKAFQQNPITSDQQQRIEMINEKLHQLGRFLITVTPECPEQTRILNMLHDANLLAADTIRKNEA
jgi:hypothetical protein